MPETKPRRSLINVNLQVVLCTSLDILPVITFEDFRKQIDEGAVTWTVNEI